MSTQPSAPPPACVFAIRNAPGAGRGAFANALISAGSHIHTASDLAAHVLFREYRGEVCWVCFAYDRGRKLLVRDLIHGFTFCSTTCEAQLRAKYDSVCLRAWSVVEKCATWKGGKSGSQEDEASFVEGLEHGTGHSDSSRPTEETITKAWDAAARTATAILSAREYLGPECPSMPVRLQPTKVHRRALRHALATVPTPDVLNYQLQTLLTRHVSPTHWAATLALVDEPRPYATYRELHEHVRAALYLTAALPLPLPLHSICETMRTAKAREVHNSFGIHDGGSEFFGYGVWPSASYFNHSCRPNVVRRRIGRTWVFEATARGPIQAGEELCISYLNGDEELLTTAERRARLRSTWGFECNCVSCCEGDEKC